MLAAAIIGGAGMLANTIMSGRQSGKAKKKAREFEQQLATLEASRQDIINPYANVTNPFNDLQVATGAAEMQAEEADISLANTLDTLRASGASAGGATALAQAALRSKEGISNSIQEQEARNAQLRAEGKARQEQLMGQGEAFRFNAQEARENQKLNRVAGLGQEQRRIETESRGQMMNSISNLGSGLMSFMAGSEAGANK